MTQLVATLAMFLVAATPMLDLVEFMPPDDTPPGWKRDGDTITYTPANAGDHLNDADVFVNNGLKELAVQYYRKGASEVIVELAEFSSDSSAESAFNSLSSGKQVDIDLGDASVIEESQILFFMSSYVVRVHGDNIGEEQNQTMAALAMTLWSYLE